MSNWIDYQLDVLASDLHEINQIASRLRQPSKELVSWIATAYGQELSEDTEGLRELLDFETVKNLGFIHPSKNQARRFYLLFKDKFYGIVEGHLSEMSECFPRAIFLVTYSDMQFSYSGKKVIRAGEEAQHIQDSNHHAQSIDWALLDIFSPFRAEYDSGLEFGSLWREWLDDVITAAKDLKSAATTLGT
jgi:hypothetical protein